MKSDKILELIKNKYNKMDKAHIIMDITEFDIEKDYYKGFTDEKEKNEWLNNRFEELNKKDKDILESIIINDKLLIFNSLSSEDISLAEKLLEIYENNKTVDSVHKCSEYFIEELNNKNINVENISEKLVSLFEHELDSKQLSTILEYVIRIYQFYDNESIKKYAIVCNVSDGINGKELDCCKGKIIEGKELKILEDHCCTDEFISIGKRSFDPEEMEYLFEVDLNKYIEWDKITKKAFNDVKKMFPKEAIVLFSKY